MGKKLSVYLSDQALAILDEMVAARKAAIGDHSNVSNTLDDLVKEQGATYAKDWRMVRRAIKKYAKKDEAVEEGKPTSEAREQFLTLLERAEKLKVGDE